MKHVILNRILTSSPFGNILNNIQGPYFVRKLHLENPKMKQPCKVAVCQMTCNNSKEGNLKYFAKLVSKAAEENVKMMFFPECCDYVGNSKDESREMAEDFEGPLMTAYKSLAKEHQMWLSIGGFHEIAEIGNLPKENKMRNAHVLINSDGQIQSIYRKLHLFDVQIPEKNIFLQESEYVLGGKELVPPVATPVGLLGQLICYDLRFPEPSTILRKSGADVLTFPSAFTSTTGAAHWEIMLRARAIENQCYVIAANQYGKHNEKRYSYGQSMIVDPWGRIIAECPKYTENTIPSSDFSYAVAIIESSSLEKIRQEMPVFNHRRDDIYQIQQKSICPDIESCDPYMFATKKIPARTVFYRSNLSFAFTNIRCVVPGHVLVASIRQAVRLEDLNPDEVADLFQTVVTVQRVMEEIHNSNSSTICVQDGQHAGQTIPHVHCHILPRKMGDFNRNDDIYQEMSQHDREDNPQPIRSDEEMTAEAKSLRQYFVNK